MCYNTHRCLWPPSPSRAPSLAQLLQHNPKLSQRNSYSGLFPQPLPCLCSSFVFPRWWELLMVVCIQRALRCVTRVVYILMQAQPWNAVWTVVWSLKIACILCWMPYSASLKGYSAAPKWLSIISNHPSLPDLQLFRAWRAGQAEGFSPGRWNCANTFLLSFFQWRKWCW